MSQKRHAKKKNVEPPRSTIVCRSRDLRQIHETDQTYIRCSCSGRRLSACRHRGLLRGFDFSKPPNPAGAEACRYS
jgi:hypothetical protein